MFFKKTFLWWYNFRGWVIFDQTIQQQVDALVKSRTYYLRCIGFIRRDLSDDDCKILVHTLAMSRLDYGNVRLLGPPESTLNFGAELWHSNNNAHMDHITPVLLDLQLIDSNTYKKGLVLLISLSYLLTYLLTYLSRYLSNHTNRRDTWDRPGEVCWWNPKGMVNAYWIGWLTDYEMTL